MRIEFHPQARIEIVDSTVFYEKRISNLGEKFVNEIEHTIQIITQWPEIGNKIDNVFRKIVLNKFPYSLIYTIETDRILVVATAHHSKKPGYWRNRKI